MFVTSLELADDREGTLISPSWEMIVQAITSLDGKSLDSIILNGPNESYMGIAGGENRRFIVGGLDRAGKRFVLAEGSDNGGWELVSVGGQEGEYADFELASLDTVLEVAKTFVDLGECDARYHWRSGSAKKGER